MLRSSLEILDRFVKGVTSIYPQSIINWFLNSPNRTKLENTTTAIDSLAREFLTNYYDNDDSNNFFCSLRVAKGGEKARKEFIQPPHLGGCSIGKDLIHINSDPIDFGASSLLALFRNVDVSACKPFRWPQWLLCH